MTFEEAKAKRDRLNEDATRTGAVLNTFPKGPMNLTPDAVRATAEWKRAKAEFDTSFAALRRFNQWFIPIFARELRAERSAKISGASHVQG